MIKHGLKIRFNWPTRLRIGSSSMTYLALLGFFGVGLVYVLVVNIVSNKGTELRIIEMENKNLASENDRLEVEAARLKSLRVIEDNASGEVEVGDLEAPKDDTDNPQPVAVVPKLVPSGQPHYLPSYSQLAQR